MPRGARPGRSSPLHSVGATLAAVGKVPGGAAQQADAADEAGASDGASQLIRGVRLTWEEHEG
jgi:hypothetical protein